MIIRIFVIAFATYLTRALPFIFLKNKELPDRFSKVIDLLPYATISLLVVYSFKDLNSLTLLPSIIASAVCIVSYALKENTILSISLSTLVYMLII